MSTITETILKQNPQFDPSTAVISPSDVVAEFHHKLPGYQHTNLVDLPEVAQRVGVARVVVKDESRRLELPSFKMLGASYATFTALVEHTGIDPEAWGSIDELAELLEPHQPLKLAAATDGNHGRAVARMGHLLGMETTIFVPYDMAPARIAAIESEGATVVVTDGYYDDAIAESAAAASDDTLVISDTSWDGYVDVPRWVIEGYTTIYNEADHQMAEMGLPDPTHVFTPMGVGALAAATVAHFHNRDPRPSIIGVEPLEAACVQASLDVGEIITIESEFRTSMVGLNCGTASKIAFPTLAAGLDWTVAISDKFSDEAMRVYAENGLVSGESGAACLGGLLAIAETGGSGAVGLDSTSVVNLIITESATDPVNYERVVGHVPAF